MGRSTLLAVALAALVLASTATAAAPNYILVTGAGLPRPVLLASWDENLALLSALADAPRAGRTAVRGLGGRPRFLLAEFWAWGGMPVPTSTRQANQRGWFYPAHRRQPPVFKVMVAGTNAPRLAPARALEILARHGIPTRR